MVAFFLACGIITSMNKEDLKTYVESNPSLVTKKEVDMNEQNLVYRLLKRAEIRRQISTRKSVQEGKADRIADLLEEAAAEIERLREKHDWCVEYIRKMK